MGENMLSAQYSQYNVRFIYDLPHNLAYNYTTFSIISRGYRENDGEDFEKMTENALTQKIVGLYDSNLMNIFSINSIAKNLGKTYPYINKKVSGLIMEGIISKAGFGRAYLCSLNMDNQKTWLLLSYNELDKKEAIRKKNPIINQIDEFVLSLKHKVNINFVVVYRKGNREKAYSNVLFAVGDPVSKSIVLESFSKMGIKGDIIVELISEFPNVVLEKDFQLFGDHVILYGMESFFEMIKDNYRVINSVYNPLFNGSK